MAIINGYIIQKYEETDEFHLYNARYNEETERLSLSDEKPLCTAGYVTFDYNSKIHTCGFKTESDMAKFCGNQPSIFRHKICANCVGHFYKTK